MYSRRDFMSQAGAGLLAVASLSVDRTALAAVEPDKDVSLKTYRIPKTKLIVSRFAFGCAMTGIDWLSADFAAQTVPMIRTAYDNGITLFDLADVYGNGNAEIAMGEVLKSSPGLRKHIVLQSKCGDRFRDGGVVDNSREHILSSVEGSLKRLGTDCLDGLLLHWPDSLVQPDEVAEAFDRLEHSGKVRYFGVSNHSPEQIEILKSRVRQPLVVCQIQLSMAHWYVPPPSKASEASLNHGVLGVTVLDYCRASGIAVQAYSPLKARATTSGSSPNLLRPAEDASPEVKNAAQLLVEIGKKYDAAPAAVMLAWLLRHPANIIPIMGAIKPEHVIQNRAADRIELTREEWYRLLHAGAAIQS